MALTSSSTFDDAQNQLMNNLVWEGDPTKARDALEAVRWLRTRRPATSSRRGTQLSYESLGDMEKRLTDYVESMDSTARERRTYFARGRPRATGLTPLGDDV